MVEYNLAIERSTRSYEAELKKYNIATALWSEVSHAPLDVRNG